MKSIDFTGYFKVLRCDFWVDFESHFLIINEIFRRVRESVDFTRFFGFLWLVFEFLDRVKMAKS